MYPNSIKNVIECLKDLPGIGEKTAERLAFSLINFDKDKLTLFSESICGVRDKLTNCEVCGNICEENVCPICLDKERNNNIIFTFANNESFDMPIDELIKKCGDRIKFSPGKEPYITYKLKDQSKTLEEIKNFLKI